MEKHIIYGLHITDRLSRAAEVQQLLSKYGCSIKIRLGLHEVHNVCSPNGVILLEMFGDEAVCEELYEKLAGIDGIEMQKMVFEH